MVGVELAATGEVVGHLSDQFSADEYDGYFRIATTGPSMFGEVGEVDVYVMAQSGSSLEVVGQLNDIAPGELIYSTRFDGERAFVTTFRTIDPLFVIDLSDPTAPEIAGELKMPGFSNYMQVIDEDHVLGIGRAGNGHRSAAGAPGLTV